MTKKKKKNAHSNPAAMLNNNIYAVKGAKNKKPKGSAVTEFKMSAATCKVIKQAKKMAEIEAYAKANGVSIAKAIIHLM